MPSVSLYFVSPYAFVRDLVRCALGMSQSEIVCVGTWKTLDEAQHAVDTARPDMVVVDAALCDSQAPGLIGGCLAQHPGIKVLLWYDAEALDLTVDCLAAGAAGAIPKQASLDEFLATVRAAADGETILSSDLLALLLERFRELRRAELAADGTALSERESAMLQLIAHGATNQQIAGALGVSIQTVKNGLTRLFFRLGVNNRLEAAAWWRDRLVKA